VADGREAGSHRGCAAAAAAAGDARRVERVARRTERGVLRAGTHGELVEIRLADHHGAGGAQARDDGGVVRRPPALQDARRARGLDAAGAHVVLDRNRHAGKRADRATGPHVGIDALCLLAGGIGSDQVEGVDVTLAGIDGGEMVFQHLAGRHLAGGDS
jgi:hypothetical protein